MSEGDFNGERGSGRTWIEAGQEGGLPGAREEYGAPRGAPADLGFAPNDQRVRDLQVLHALCDSTQTVFPPGLTTAEREAFESMRDALESPNRKYETLSPKQREWAKRRAKEMDLDLRTPAERNANVPRGAEVESRAAQLGLPLAPPGCTADLGYHGKADLGYHGNPFALPSRAVGQGLDALFEPGPPAEDRSSMGYGPRFKDPARATAKEVQDAVNEEMQRATAPANSSMMEPSLVSRPGARRRPRPVAGMK